VYHFQVLNLISRLGQNNQFFHRNVLIRIFFGGVILNFKCTKIYCFSNSTKSPQMVVVNILVPELCGYCSNTENPVG
jgi:hypothetical protein